MRIWETDQCHAFRGRWYRWRIDRTGDRPVPRVAKSNAETETIGTVAMAVDYARGHFL